MCDIILNKEKLEEKINNIIINKQKLLKISFRDLIIENEKIKLNMRIKSKIVEGDEKSRKIISKIKFPNNYPKNSSRKIFSKNKLFLIKLIISNNYEYLKLSEFFKKNEIKKSEKKYIFIEKMKIYPITIPEKNLNKDEKNIFIEKCIGKSFLYLILCLLKSELNFDLMCDTMIILNINQSWVYSNIEEEKEENVLQHMVLENLDSEIASNLSHQNKTSQYYKQNYGFNNSFSKNNKEVLVFSSLKNIINKISTESCSLFY